MQIDSLTQSDSRKRLSTAEKERRRKGNLCLYCGEPGHKADKCPKKSKKIAVVSEISKHELKNFFTFINSIINFISWTFYQLLWSSRFWCSRLRFRRCRLLQKTFHSSGRKDFPH
ncbi:hypothetical protein BKA69DRAFT_1108374 [Paraphysoderma sedebokerense]|nr:hypothetical protein BKA69DRAFT_1108374 [Paraphysoderma sedebokerense]